MSAETYERIWGSPPVGALAVIEQDEPVDVDVAVRAATADLYEGPMGGSAVGPSTVIVPRLDQWRSKITDPVTSTGTNPIMFGPIWRLGFRFGTIPAKVFRLLAPPEPGPMMQIEAPDHPAYPLLRNPNREAALTGPMLFAGTVASMVQWGKAGWWKERDGRGRVVTLWPLPGDRFYPVRDTKRLLGGFKLRTRTGGDTPLRVEDVCYFRLMPDPRNWIDGWSPLQTLGDVADASAESIASLSRIVRTGILQRWWVGVPGELDEEALSRLEGQMDRARELRDAVPVLEQDAKLNNAGDGPNDALLTRAVDLAQALVKFVFGFGPEDEPSRFYGDVIQPLAVVIEAELERSLMSEWPDDLAYPEFMFRNILIGTPKEQAEYWQTRILSGQATPDQAARAQNDPPFPGGDQHFVPLNLVPIDAASSTPPEGTPKKGSSDGLGGDEGKGTGAPVPGTSAKAGMRAARAENWGTLRSRMLSATTTACARRLRGVLKSEVARIRKAITGPYSRGTRAGEVPLPQVDELVALLRESDPDLADRLRQFMAQTSEDAWGAAAALVAVEAGEVATQVGDLLEQRIAAVVARFSAFREDRLRTALGEFLADPSRIGDLDQVISDWGSAVSSAYVDSMARTETAFAFERGAMVSWAQAGFTTLDFVFGGGPCSTGVCEDAAAQSPIRIGEGLGNVGASFSDADAPPLHPSCTCFTVVGAEPE